MNLVISEVLPTDGIREMEKERNMSTTWFLSQGSLDLPLCSPRNTSLNFFNGFPKSAFDIVTSESKKVWIKEGKGSD